MRRIILFPTLFNLILIFALFYGVSNVLSTERERITPENIDRLTEIASIGRGTVRNLVWTPDSQGFVVSDDAKLYYYATGNLDSPPSVIEHPSSRLFNAKISPDNRYLAATTIRYTESRIVHDQLWIWDLSTSEIVGSTTALDNTFFDNDERITDYFFVPSTSNVYVLTTAGRMFMWDYLSPTGIEIIDVEIPPTFASRLLSPDGQWFIELAGRHISVWDTASWSLTIDEAVTEHLDGVYGPEDASFSADNALLLVTYDMNLSLGNGVMLLSLDDGTLITSLQLDETEAVQLGTDSTPLLITHNCDKPEPDDFHLILSNLISGDIVWESALQSTSDPVFTLATPTYACRRSNASPGTDIILWDLTTGDNLGYYSLRYYSYYAFSPDRTKLLTGSTIEDDIQGWRAQDTSLNVVSLETGDILSGTTDFIHHIYTPEFSPDSRYLFMGDKERIRRWDLLNGEISRDFQVDWEYFHNPRLVYTDFAFDSSSMTIRAQVSSSNGSEATALWNWKTAEFINIAGDFHNGIFDHQYDRIAEITAHDSNGDTTITLREIATQNDVNTFTVPGQVRMVTFSPDDQYLAFMTYSGGIYVWDIANELWILQAQSQLEERAYWYRNARFVHHNKWLITSTSSGYTEVWDMQTQTRWGQVAAIEFSPDETVFAAINADDQTLRFYDTNTGEPVPNTFSVENAADVAFSPDGRLLAVQSYHEPIDWAWLPPSEIWLFEVMAGELLATLDNHAALYNPFFSPDGTLLAVQAADRRLIVYGIE